MQLANVSLRALRYLVAVADASSVTGAAQRLHVSQPAISAAVAGLELDLGVALLLRHHARGVTLTPAGAHVVAEARALLRHAEDFVQSASSLGLDLAGEVQMGWFQTLSPRYLPALLVALRRSMPLVSLAVEEGDHAQMMRGLTEGRTELALTYHFEIPAGIEVTPVAELAPVAVIAAGHRLAGAAATSLAALAEEPYLMLDLPHSREYFHALFSRAGLAPRIAFRSRSQDLLRGLIGHGLGWTIQNVRPERPYATDGTRIVAVPLEPGLEPARLVLATPPERMTRPVVRAVAGQVLAAFQPGGLFHPPGGKAAARTLAGDEAG